MMVPYPAGGASDYVARLVQQDFQKAIGQTVIIENLGGVSGTLGAQKVLNAPADGKTLMLATPIEPIMGPMALAVVKYKPENFKLANLISTTSIVLLANKNVPANNIDEFLQWAKGRKVSYGSTGSGSLYHLMGEKLAKQTGIDALHVPYKGGNQLMTDLLGGQVDVAFFALAGPVPAMIKEQKVRGIGVSTSTPLPQWPELSPLARHPQLKDFEMDIWAGVVASEKTPDSELNRVNEAMTEAMKNPASRKSLEEAGNTVAPPMTLQELQQFYSEQTEKYRKLFNAINYQPQ